MYNEELEHKQGSDPKSSGIHTTEYILLIEVGDKLLSPGQLLGG